MHTEDLEMVDNWGTGFPDFTSETAISGTASVSGNVVGISGEVMVSGSVAIVTNLVLVPKILQVTGASGGMALGSGLTTSGYAITNVIIKIPENKTSGSIAYGTYFNSGGTSPVVYIGGCSSDAPYPGSGFICSGKGLIMAPGEAQRFTVGSLNYIYATAELSGNPLSYIVEMR